MNDYELEAFIYDKKIGTILLKDGIVYFQYDKNFKMHNLNISPLKLPLDMQGVYTNNDDKYFEGLAGVFYDGLPDKFGIKIIWRYFESKNIPIKDINIIQKLMFISNKSIGAITYKPIIQNTAINNELIELGAFYKNAKKIIDGSDIDVIDEMLTFMDSAGSIGGARAKAVVGYNPKTNEMISGTNYTLRDGFEHYIIKFDIGNESGDSSDFTKLEYIYMSMAKEVGINIPEITLLKHNNLQHFLIKRFDRVDNKPIHIHSVAGLTHSNFNIPLHYSYDELFRLTRYLTSNQSEVIEQYKRMVFNIIGRNQDDHAKNFSFMMDNQGIWSLTPAYDITYANGEGYTKNHQLSLKGKVNNFTRDDLISIALEHSIKKSDAMDIIDNTIEKFIGFRNRALRCGINEGFVDDVCVHLRVLL